MTSGDDFVVIEKSELPAHDSDEVQRSLPADSVAEDGQASSSRAADDQHPAQNDKLPNDSAPAQEATDGGKNENSATTENSCDSSAVTSSSPATGSAATADTGAEAATAAAPADAAADASSKVAPVSEAGDSSLANDVTASGECSEAAAGKASALKAAVAKDQTNGDLAPQEAVAAAPVNGDSTSS